MNDSGGLPGGTIHSWALGPFPQFTTVNTIQPSQTIDTEILGLSLIGGTTYWLAAERGASDTVLGWNSNDSGLIGPFAFAPYGGAWAGFNHELSAFAVYGNPEGVPDPSTMLLLGTGLAGLLVRRRKATRS